MKKTATENPELPALKTRDVNTGQEVRIAVILLGKELDLKVQSVSSYTICNLKDLCLNIMY